MIISNVNIGSGVGVGDGDSLYAAFYKVNQNFANVQSNVNALTNSVSSVAGRTGNVTLTIADVVGLSTTYASQANITTANTLMKGYVDGQITAANTVPNTANIGMKGYVDLVNTIQSAIITSSNSSMKNYVDGQITAANSAPNTANVGMIGYVNLANTIQSAQMTAANLGIIGYVDNKVSTANIGVLGYINSQVTAANVAWQANATTQSILIDSLNTAFVNLAANAEVQQGNIYTLETRINTVNSSIALGNTIQSAQISAANLGIIGYIGQQITTANVGIKGYVDLANSIQQSLITTANIGIIGYIDLGNTIQSAQISSANIGIIGYVDNKVSTANIGVIGYIGLGNTIQSAQIGAANIGMKGYVDNQTYSNVQVTAYLPSYSGNVGGAITIGGNLTVSNVYVPTANNSSGTKGQITYDGSYVYVCIGTNTWRRANLAAW